MKRSGFTLIELLIVIVIVAILAGAMVPMLTANRVMAQQAKARSDMDTIRTGALMLRQDTTQWPAAIATPGQQDGRGVFLNQDLAGAVIPQWSGPYVSEWATADGAAGIPGADPWGFRYRIISGTTAGVTWRDVATYGDLGVVGGTGAAQDIAIRMCSGC
jgi:general secretion pathway protein G